MESFNNISNNPEKVIPPIPVPEQNSPEAIEYVSKFEHLKEDLENLFNIEVTSEASLSYPWVKDEMYAKILEDFEEEKPFALDYMFEEGLLTREDLEKRGIKDMKPQALHILQTFKGPRLISAKNLFIATGLLTEEEVEMAANHQQ